MAKQTASKNISEIKKSLKEGKMIIGTERTMKGLRQGKLEKVYLSSNCSEDVKNDIKHYSQLSNVNVVELSQPNEELGVICKKTFSISVLGQLK